MFHHLEVHTYYIPVSHAKCIRYMHSVCGYCKPNASMHSDWEKTPICYVQCMVTMRFMISSIRHARTRGMTIKTHAHCTEQIWINHKRVCICFWIGGQANISTANQMRGMRTISTAAVKFWQQKPTRQLRIENRNAINQSYKMYAFWGDIHTHTYAKTSA